jgi:nicotinic acid phosphoribosyltransferase
MDTGLHVTNPLSCVLLNDLYQITMAYAYWKANKQYV